MTLKKKAGEGGSGFGGCQGGCERRIKVIVKMERKQCWGRGGQGGGERRMRLYPLPHDVPRTF